MDENEPKDAQVVPEELQDSEVETEQVLNPDTLEEPVSKSEEPAEADESAEPDAPAESEEPAEPDAPAESDAPAAADESAEPDAPAEADESAEPDAPAETEQEEPAKPKKPIYKRWYFWAIIAVVVAAAGVGAFFYIKSQPVDISGSVNVTFSGFDKYGKAELGGSYKMEMDKVFADKGIPDQERGYYAEDLKITLDKDSALSNGQEVVVSITPSFEKSPFVKTTRTFTVSGLEEMPPIKNLDDVLSRVDSRVRSDVAGNSAYSYEATREPGYYVIGGSIADTNSYSEAEKADAPVDSRAISVVALYRLQGTGWITDDESGYAYAGFSNVPIEKDGTIPAASLSQEKNYIDLKDGNNSMTYGFLNWFYGFKSAQDATDFLITHYPAATKME